MRCSLRESRDRQCFLQMAQVGSWCEWKEVLIWSTKCSILLNCLKQAAHLCLFHAQNNHLCVSKKLIQNATNTNAKRYPNRLLAQLNWHKVYIFYQEVRCLNLLLLIIVLKKKGYICKAIEREKPRRLEWMIHFSDKKKKKKFLGGQNNWLWIWFRRVFDDGRKWEWRRLLYSENLGFFWSFIRVNNKVYSNNVTLGG